MLRTAPVVLIVLALLLASPLALAQTQDTVTSSGPRLEVLAPTSPLPAKERVNLFLEVVNLGPGTARNVSVFVQPVAGSGLVVIGQLVRGLEDIPQNQSDLLVVRVATPDTAGGAGLTLRFTFTGPNGETIVRERQVDVQIKPPVSDPLEIERIPTPLEAGNETTLGFVMSNPADTAITDLDVVMNVETSVGGALGQIAGGGSSDSASPGSTSSLIVQGGRLEPGQTRTVEAPMLAALRADELVTMTLTATYSLEGFQREQIFDFGARVVGSVNVRVLEAREVDTGEGIEIAGTVVNVGSGTAWNPRVSAAEESGLRSASPLLIEDLEPNDAVSFRLPVTRVGPRVEGAPLFVMDWNDDYGNIFAPRAVAGDLAELPPSPPSRLEAIRAWFVATPGALWALLALELLIVAALAVGIMHAARVRREDAAREDAAIEEPIATETPTVETPGEAPPPARPAPRRASRLRAWWESWRRPPRKPKGKSGARPGA